MMCSIVKRKTQPLPKFTEESFAETTEIIGHSSLPY